MVSFLLYPHNITYWPYENPAYLSGSDDTHITSFSSQPPPLAQFSGKVYLRDRINYIYLNSYQPASIHSMRVFCVYELSSNQYQLNIQLPKFAQSLRYACDCDAWCIHVFV